MKCTILGCGTSTGVPLPGCRCQVCLSKDPRNYRNRTSALIELDSGHNVLIDASPDLRQQALTYDIRQIHSVIITHAHSDHILGIDDLRSYNFIHRKRIRVYGTAPTLEGIRRMFWYIVNPDPDYQGGLLAQLDLIEISNESPFEIDGVEFIPFPLYHGKTEVTGFRVGSLGYATDCKNLSSRAEAVLSDCEYLILDALRFEPHPTHLSVPEAIEVAQKLRVKETYLVHMTHTIDYHEASKLLPPGIALGYDGLPLTFT